MCIRDSNNSESQQQRRNTYHYLDPDSIPLIFHFEGTITSMASTLTVNGVSRPSTGPRNLTAPSVQMNGHFAASDATDRAQYEHGVQVIDSDKNFK